MAKNCEEKQATAAYVINTNQHNITTKLDNLSVATTNQSALFQHKVCTEIDNGY